MKKPWAFLQRAAWLGALALTATAATGQELPSDPISLAGGRVTIGGEASLSTSTNADDPGWFNYTDYEHNALRTIRLGFSVALRANDHVAVLGEMRSENWDALRPYAIYVRYRPWTKRPVDVQAGRIPPTFGAFARRSYAADNPLIGYPLAYQYLTSIRTDAVPATADDLLRMRGRGWRVSYPLGIQSPDRGVPLVTAFRWDTGVQVRVGSDPVSFSAAITNGTLSDPRVGDDNRGKQLSVRFEVRPFTGLVIGASGARGPYLAQSLAPVLPAGASNGRFTQRGAGFDVEYSRGYWVLRTEGVFSDWRLPAIAAPLLTRPLRAFAVYVEGRYKVMPGMYLAGRFDRLDFSQLAGSRVAVPWDAPVTRVETGIGYYIRRNLLAKGVYQRNLRDGGARHHLSLGAAQLQFWL